LNHACLIDGARLSGAAIHKRTHGDLAQLETQLRTCDARRKLILSDAVFSMDGDIADIPSLLELCERHDALLLVDDAHGLGVLGPQGRGTLAHFGLIGANASARILYMATLGKALGVAGAFVAGSAPLIEWLLQKTRSYIFATAAPPMLAHALRASLQCVQRDQWRRDCLTGLIQLLRTRLGSGLAGKSWRLLESTTPIQPLMVGDNASALALMEGLRLRGLWVPAIRPPTVPAGTARLRITLSAAHTAVDVERLTDAILALSEMEMSR
jgi:8-amino-7-oxononanoate synthase